MFLLFFAEVLLTMKTLKMLQDAAPLSLIKAHYVLRDVFLLLGKYMNN